MDSEQEILGHIDGSTTATATTSTTTAALEPDGNVSSAASAVMAGATVPAGANEKLPTKLITAGVHAAGGPATAAKSGKDDGTWGKAMLTQSSATVGGEIGRGRLERANGEEPPWKGFKLSDGKLELYC